eukprot:TRINITY_DN67571_c0_g1_i1.p1 TRINITY_DN67571_c0_g1~~TRINITY_DN67571_c0_g1_i1.p1  ORF type:complete len:211 (+),score=51.88 TRINITY_DN67571_c0_g1_i1:51-683(+)
MLQQEKKLLRREVQAVLRGLSQEEVGVQSRAVWSRCNVLPVVQSSRGASVYLDMACEVRTSGLIDALFSAGKRVFVPCIVGPNYADMVMIEVSGAEEISTWPRNKWGIPELPKEEAVQRQDMACSGAIDLVFTPGVAFTRSCDRLGHGKGYYDSFFARTTVAHAELGLSPPRMVGLALSQQIVPCIPTGEHDVPLTAVVSPDAVFEAKSV